MCILGRISLTLFSFINNFCDCEEMRASEKEKGAIVPWLRKGHEGFSFRFFLGGGDFCVTF